MLHILQHLECVGNTPVRPGARPDERAPAFRACCSDPSCNTGVETSRGLVHVPRSTFAVHWLQGTGNYDAHDQIEDFSRHLGQDNWEARDRCLFGYKASFVSADGLQVHTAPSTVRMPESLVIASGETCEALGWDRLRLLAIWGLKLTRVHVAFDQGDVSPRTFTYLWERGYARSRVHRSSCSYLESPEGTTFYMGAPGGTHRLVTSDRRGFNRAELRLRGSRANALLEGGHFFGSAEEARGTGLGSLRGLDDFVDPASSANTSRRSLLPWWERWLAAAARAFEKLLARVASSFAARFAQLRKQVAPTLARVVDAVEQLLAEGRSRLGSRAEHADGAIFRAHWLAEEKPEVCLPRGALFPAPESSRGYPPSVHPVQEQLFFRRAEAERI